MTSYNHVVQKVCYTVLKNYCQEGILCSLACLAYSKLIFFCTLVVWCFNFFRNLFTGKLPFFTFQGNVFPFDTTKGKCNKNRHFHILEKNVLRCRFWFVLASVLWGKRVLSILGECCFRAGLCSQEAAQNSGLHRQECLWLTVNCNNV